MKRFALIIEASDIPGEGKLPGAAVDAAAYRNWIYSKSGGDWYDGEIVILSNPTVSEVKKALAVAGKVDYAFVTFSGHGYHQKELDETKVCLKFGTMTARELRPDGDRCTIIIDACRKVMAEEDLLEMYQLSTAEARIKAARMVERNYRQDFETQVASAEKGAVFLYSCDLNEAAGESSRGGYFSRSMVQVGENFKKKYTDGTKWLSMDKAFQGAAVLTTEKERSQHPKAEFGRRLAHFPFAV